MRRLLLQLISVALLTAACGSVAGPTNAGGPTTTTTTEQDPVAEVDPTSTPPIDVISPTSNERPNSDPESPIAELAGSVNSVGFDLLRSQPIEENSVLSPVSIGHAVLMARAAADDSTGAAIDDALTLTEGISPHEAWNTIDQTITADAESDIGINGDPTPIVEIADRIWPAQSASPTQEWVDLLAQYHGADVSTIDVGQPEASRVQINQWVSENTEGLIPELLPAGFINESTQLVLTDTVYFEAEWDTLFAKYGEVAGEFTQLDGSTQPVSFMRDLEGRGARGTGDGWSAAVLPYRGDEFSMTVIVPEQGRFEEIRSNLSAEFIDAIDASIEPGPYELLLPRWEDNTNIDLLPWLTDIGAAPGNYPGIGEDVFLSGGVHAADIAVDEYGTVAAAATGLSSSADSGPPEPELTIAADKPFFYLIRHEDTGVILFVGQVTNPNA